MYFVYAIQSESGRVYVGQTQNLEERLSYHNSGYVKSTSGDSNWRYVKTQSFETRELARYFEWQLKKSRGRRLKWLNS
ncbi:MAG: GIY-YIG nuclease family protein [Verrucomicrobia bacterium]|nr:GIY-YIG nuclease family protein [Verrucomicrobiota bacterium]